MASLAVTTSELLPRAAARVVLGKLPKSIVDCLQLSNAPAKEWTLAEAPIMLAVQAGAPVLARNAPTSLDVATITRSFATTAACNDAAPTDSDHATDPSLSRLPPTPVPPPLR